MSSIDFSHALIALVFAGVWYMVNVLKQQLLQEVKARDAVLNERLATRDARITTEFTTHGEKFATELTTRDENFTAEAQRILMLLNASIARLDEIERALEGYHNNFGRVATEFESINGSIETLQNEINQRYAIVQRTEQIGEAFNDGQSEASSASSGQLTFTGISLTVWTQFKQIFDRVKTENRYSLEEMCLFVAMDIRNLGGNIKKTTVQGFYERNIKKKDGYISTLDQIGSWIDCKNNDNDNLARNTE